MPNTSFLNSCFSFNISSIYISPHDALSRLPPCRFLFRHQVTSLAPPAAPNWTITSFGSAAFNPLLRIVGRTSHHASNPHPDPRRCCSETCRRCRGDSYASGETIAPGSGYFPSESCRNCRQIRKDCLRSAPASPKAKPVRYV